MFSKPKQEDLPPQPAPPSSSFTAAAPVAATPAPAPVPAAPGAAFFLSDKDLLQNQPAVDDGEVDE